MDYEIVWTREAEVKLAEVSEYLIRTWSLKSFSDFTQRLNDQLDTLIKYPYSFRIIENSENREAVLTRHNLLIYRVEDDKIILLTVWDTRMNPENRMFK
jgi:plasmid stabilization system protein ParE